MSEIITGILFGLSTLLFMGAVFFYLIKTAIVYGKKSGYAAAIGVIFGDIIYVLLLLLGAANFLSSSSFIKWFTGIGGILLLVLGLRFLFKRQFHFFTAEENKSKETLPVINHFLKGFAINFFNPFVVAVWLGFYTLTLDKFEYSYSHFLVLSITLLVIFCTDVLKVFFADKLSRYLNGNILQYAFKIVGLIMILFALKLFYGFYFN